MQETAAIAQKRSIQVANLDPAAEQFDYEPMLDIRELIQASIQGSMNFIKKNFRENYLSKCAKCRNRHLQVDDVMEDTDLRFGPNGGLVFCLEFLLENLDWLEEKLKANEIDEDYVLFDCPGQIELYTHLPVMRRLVDVLQSWNFR